MQVPRRHNTWFKSSYSNNANACVEVRFDRAAVHVRDSKDHLPGPLLQFGTSPWAAFVHNLRA